MGTNISPMIKICYQLSPVIRVMNSLASGRCSCYLKLMIFKLISRIHILSISCEIALRDVSWNLWVRKLRILSQCIVKGFTTLRPIQYINTYGTRFIRHLLWIENALIPVKTSLEFTLVILAFLSHANFVSNHEQYFHFSLRVWHRLSPGPLLLTWFNFHPSMDK